MTAFLDMECDNDIRFTKHELNCALRQDDHFNCSGSLVIYARFNGLIFRFCEKHKTDIPSYMKKLSDKEMVIIDVMTI
jgi:hypothetical protein